MDTISIKSDKFFRLGLIKQLLSQFFRIDEDADGGLTIHAKDSRVYLHFDRHIEHAEGTTILLDYSDMEFVKKIIEVIADDPGVLVDNDFGTVISGDLFVARMKNENGWNWKIPPPAAP
jgi:hypothetical protein